MVRSHAQSVATKAEDQLVGVWTVESFYSEFKATGDKTAAYGARPNGYAIFAPEKRLIVILTAEHRMKPDTDEDCIAAFRSMVAYSGIYRVEADRFTRRSISRGMKRGRAQSRSGSSSWTVTN